MTAPTPLGPWVRRGIALAGFAHNPQAVMVPNSSTILLFHIGEPLQKGCLKDCRKPTNSTDPDMVPGSSDCPPIGHGTSVAVAQDFDGPWTRYSFILGSELTNPAPYVLPNGSIYLGTRRTSSKKFPAWMGHISSPGGPWRPLESRVVSTAQQSVTVSEEDSFIWRNKRGYHQLTHRAVKVSDGWPPHPSTGCGGGHLFSLDLITWYIGGNAFGRSANDSAQCDISMRSDSMEVSQITEPGSASRTTQIENTIRLTSRQRPTVFQTSTGRQFLYTGASGPSPNITEYQHSWTLVQEINMA